MKSLYRHKQSGDIFAIETDEAEITKKGQTPLKPGTATYKIVNESLMAKG